MSSGVVRLHEQLRAVWKARDKEEPIVRGHLLLGPANDRSVVERWFVLLGHSFFYTIQRDSPEYCGALLTDIFSPVVSRVDEKTLEDFNSPESPPEPITQVHVTIAYSLNTHMYAVYDNPVSIFMYCRYSMYSS